jgi:hypothetical protein
MGNYLSNTIKTLILVLLTNDYFQRNYPDQYKMFFIKLSYNSIYLYSKTQLFYNKLKNRMNLFIESNSSLKKIINEIYKDHPEVKFLEFNNEGTILLRSYNLNENPNIEIKDTNSYLFLDIKNNKTNYITTNSYVFPNDYELSNIKFLLVELVINNKKFKIDLKTENDNYYIVSNVFDKNFFLYFMFNYSHTFEEKIVYHEILESIDTAKINLIDHKVNNLEVDFSKNGSISILKDGYVINHTSSTIDK